MELDFEGRLSSRMEEGGPKDEDDELFYINAGAWIFPIPKIKLASFPHSLLYREACLLSESDRTRIFLDRDGFVFSHIHQFLLLSQLPISSLSELDLLYEQASGLNLMAVIEAIDKLKAGKEEKTILHEQVVPEIPASEKAPINRWKTYKCNSRLYEWPPKMSLSPGIRDTAPLGLLVDPFLDAEEEVHYCFFPIDILKQYPALVTDDNLLWFSEKFILLECGSPQFRFIGNFLYSGNFFLPDNFLAFEDLEAEINSVGIPDLLKALLDEKNDSGKKSSHYVDMPGTWHSSNSLTASKTEHSSGAKPFYVMSLDLLGKYPDSALGQLYIESSVGGSKLYISGSGTLFQHVKNWLGACGLPLTSSALEIQGLCLYLDKGDVIYQPMREAMRTYLNYRLNRSPGASCESWIADVQQYSATQIVRVYVRSHWYATLLKTLLKYPELLANAKKTRWITCGFSLLVIGDGSIFRHVLNFLRLGRLLLPSDFKEWRLLCQEVNEFQISALKEALRHCPEYRLWLKENGSTECSLDPKHEDLRSEGIMSVDGLKSHRINENASCVTSAEGLNKDGCKKRKAPSTSPVTPSQCYNPDGFPSTKCWKLDQTVEGEKANFSTSPMLKLISLVKKLHDSAAMDSVRDELQEHAYCARSHMEGMELADLGAILWVHHHHLVANDGSTASFQDCIVYTTEHDIKELTHHGATTDDLVFLSVNMSHEEVFYARKCHSFLTGIILDSLEQKDSKSTRFCVAGLVSMLWVDQIPARQFIEDLLTLEMYRDESTKETLLCWLQVRHFFRTSSIFAVQ
ncbi:PREDICTED: BTB/POZ domain-containing protein KCTD19 [Nanorana parkeri]|uniref:BTB/POZ domain-containing protein KCTD19 n=1 Tax=Nanorana parkeri TaxID=125878 RepID=UPI000853F6D6|nr:PREDICTED: BTB/POZ domain-containing protein KCTD19 [Nanorana parkeri]